VRNHARSVLASGPRLESFLDLHTPYVNTNVTRRPYVRLLASFVQGECTPSNVRNGLNDEFSLTRPYALLQHLGGIPREHRNPALAQCLLSESVRPHRPEK